MTERFAEDFKRFFLRGLAAGLPALLTVALLVLFFSKIQQYIGRYINVAVQWLAVQLSSMFAHLPLTWRGNLDEWAAVEHFWNTYHFGWLGFLLAFVAIYIFGRFVASIIGRWLWRIIERAFFRLPVIKQIYPAAKQVTDYLLSPDRNVDFSRVVAVEYPRKGCWSMGLVTGPGLRTIQDRSEGTMLTVFIPSSPTPVTGYTIVVSRTEVVDLPISIDEALRYTVSGGVIMPLTEQLREAESQDTANGAFRGLQEPEDKKTKKTRRADSEHRSQGPSHGRD